MDLVENRNPFHFSLVNLKNYKMSNLHRHSNTMFEKPHRFNLVHSACTNGTLHMYESYKAIIRNKTN